ncbi:SCO family protein [Nocardioides korecus]
MNTNRLTPRGSLLTAALAAVLTVSGLTGCSNATATKSDQKSGSAAIVQKDTDGLTGTRVDNPPLQVAAVTLRDTNGHPVNLADLPARKATVLFFGFTHCDDVCPTTMADLATARRTLPDALAQRVNIRFVTVDPNRDTPTVLRRWLDQFGTDVTGLRGPTTLVNKAERSLYADASSTTAPTPAPTPTDPSAHADGHHHSHDGKKSATGHDQVSHSGSVYVFGPHGETVLYTGGTTPQQYAADLTHLLRQP